MIRSRAHAEASRPSAGPAAPEPIAPATSSEPWQALILRARIRINCGWMADALAPLFLVAGLASCILLLILRSLNQLPRAGDCAIAAGGLLILLPVLAYWRARRRFASMDDARVRLEAHLGLHNALSAASRGMRPWPPLPPSRSARLVSGLSWSWPSLILPPLLTAALIAIPFLLPAPLPAPEPLPANQPLAWETMDDWLNQLAEKEIADPERVREFQKDLDSLRQTPSGEWFGNSSLEATDALQTALERSVEELESQLSRSAQALSLLESQSGQLSAADRQSLQSQLEALDGLSRPELPLHPSRLEELRKCGSSQGADPAASRALCEALRQNAQSLRELMSQSDALRQKWENKLQADALLGKIASEGPESVPGQGAPTRGPGEAPLHYKDEQVNLGTQAPEQISNPDPSRAAPGDLLRITAAKPTVENSRELPQTSAGALTASGKGGHEIWEATTLLPAERSVLRRYFR